MKINYISEGVIAEGGLSRVLTHRTQPFAILTAYRGDYSLKENRARNRQLESKLRSISAGGMKLVGHWQEGPDGEWSPDLDPELLTDVVEESYFVPKPNSLDESSFREWVVGVLVEFSQDAAVYSDGEKIYLIDQNHDLITIGNNISVGKVQQAYSEIRGKSFVFEGSIYPSSIAHRMALKNRNIFWK